MTDPPAPPAVSTRYADAMKRLDAHLAEGDEAAACVRKEAAGLARSSDSTKIAWTVAQAKAAATAAEAAKRKSAPVVDEGEVTT